MRKLAYLITHNELANHYTLNALGNNISRYIDVPKKQSSVTGAMRVLWEFTCDACGTTATGIYPAAVSVTPSPCAARDCRGTMLSKDGGCVQIQKTVMNQLFLRLSLSAFWDTVT